MEKRREVVNLQYRVNKAFKGKYFIGHTPILSIFDSSNSWGGLINPEDSGVNLYVCTFTVSNYSSNPFRAQLWLNSSPVGGRFSPFVSPSNTAQSPLPIPKTNLLYAQNIHGVPSDGTSILSRIAEADSTNVANYYGKIVIPPGGSFIAFLYSPGAQRIRTEVAFGWWEDKESKFMSSWAE